MPVYKNGNVKIYNPQPLPADKFEGIAFPNFEQAITSAINNAGATVETKTYTYVIEYTTSETTTESSSIKNQLKDWIENNIITNIDVPVPASKSFKGGYYK